MYLSIPDTFFVPVCCDRKDVLKIERVVILDELKFHSYFTNDAIKRKELLIGISLPTQREERWVRDKEVMEKYAQEKGAITKVENADTDVAKQDLQVKDLISQNVDILILAPVDSLAAGALVEEAHNSSIKVIGYDRPIENINLDLYISFNGLRVGELQGRFLTQKVPKGNYIIMSGDPRDSNSKLFKDGAMEYIKPLADKGDIKIVTDKEVNNWDPRNAFKIVEDSLIANNNKIDAILAPNDATAGAAIQALEAQGLAGKVIVTGQDADLAAAQRIVQGTQAMTVLKDTRQLGRVTIDAAIKLAKEEPVEINGIVVNVSSILLAPIAVDKSNIDEVLIESGYLKKEDVYKK